MKLVCLYCFHLRFCVKKINYLDCVHAEALHEYSPKCTCLRVQSARHSDESVARESVHSWPVTECKYGVSSKIYMASHPSPKLLAEICCCQLLVFLCMFPVVYLFLTFLGVQSSV